MAAASKPYTPPERIWRALAFADLLDAAGIGSMSVEAMDSTEWAMLACATGPSEPSLETCQLTVTIRAAAKKPGANLRP